MKSKTNVETDIAQTLGIDQPSGHSKRLSKWLVVALLAIVVLTTSALWKGVNKADSVQYKTQEVRQGDLTITVTATGTLEPTNQVEVGSEQSGIIKSVEVNYNDQVELGQVLAKLDTEKLQAQVLQSKAALASARAKVLQAQATLTETRNTLDRLKQVYEMSHQKVPSRNELEAAEAAFNRAQADEASAKALVSEAEAKLEANQTDLSKAVIRSPINGIVLSRDVEPGQTVAASLQAPVLFILAENLTQMELHVAVDEADVGQVIEGQVATFTVDAYPDKEFPAKITQVRYASQTVDGVVTYETVLNLDNSDLLLRPGMTATADIIVRKVEDAILVPNTALRFAPPEEQNKTSKDSEGLLSALLPGPPRRNASANQGRDANVNKNKQRVWILQNGSPVPISVKTGSSDGQMTEILTGDIKPGLPLLVDMGGTVS